MRRTGLILSMLLVLASLTTSLALAGNPHFVYATFSTEGNTVTVSAKEAGLGDEEQIVATLSGDAACLNPGGNHPKAANKESFATSAVVPIQNGKAEYTLTLAATFQPDCTPPMTVEWSNVVLTDETNGLTATP